MAEQQRNARLVAIRQNIAAVRRRAELARWQEQRERLLAIRPRSEAEHQAQVQEFALKHRLNKSQTKTNLAKN